MSWETWFQDVGASVINKAADAKWTQPYEVDKLRLRALGELGLYEEGQAGNVAAAPAGGLLGMSQGTTLLLIGGAVMLFLMSKD